MSESFSLFNKETSREETSSNEGDTIMITADDPRTQQEKMESNSFSLRIDEQPAKKPTLTDGITISDSIPDVLDRPILSFLKKNGTLTLNKIEQKQQNPVSKPPGVIDLTKPGDVILISSPNEPKEKKEHKIMDKEHIHHRAHHKTKDIIRIKPKKKDPNDSDVDSSDVEELRQKVTHRAKYLEIADNDLEILGAHVNDGEMDFAVLHKKEGKVYWHSNESMRLEHLALLLNYYEKNISLTGIVVGK